VEGVAAGGVLPHPGKRLVEGVAALGIPGERLWKAELPEACYLTQVRGLWKEQLPWAYLGRGCGRRSCRRRVTSPR